jgi:hypothetical protein
MAGLQRSKVKDAKDPAEELVRQYPDRDALQIEILRKLELPKRRLTSVSYPRTSSVPELKWVSRTFAEINFGRNPDFSLPRKIEIAAPGPVLDAEDLDIRLVDTRGVDEPAAPRRDIQMYLDDGRALLVLCSGFGDAPDAAVQAVIERAREAGVGNSFVNRTLLLVLPRNNVESTVLDPATGDSVESIEDGRAVRSAQIAMSLANLGVPGLQVCYLDANSKADCEQLSAILVERLRQLRADAERQVVALAATADNLSKNRANLKLRAIFEAATKPLLAWFKSNRDLGAAHGRVDEGLIEKINALRYASSLRASVRRHGDWHNFDYWHGLGFGARRNIVGRSERRLEELRVLIRYALADSSLESAHEFLKHFLGSLDEASKSLFVNVQALGETAFAAMLRGDQRYWDQCQDRWGQGPGYKTDVRDWTAGWFSERNRSARHNFIESEIRRAWAEMLQGLEQQLELSAAQ